MAWLQWSLQSSCYYLKGQNSCIQMYITKFSTNLYVLSVCLFIYLSSVGNQAQYSTTELHPSPGS